VTSQDRHQPGQRGIGPDQQTKPEMPADLDTTRGPGTEPGAADRAEGACDQSEQAEPGRPGQPDQAGQRDDYDEYEPL